MTTEIYHDNLRNIKYYIGIDANQHLIGSSGKSNRQKKPRRRRTAFTQVRNSLMMLCVRLGYRLGSAQLLGAQVSSSEVSERFGQESGRSDSQSI